MSNSNLTRREFVKITGMGGAASLFLPSFATDEAKKKSDIVATFILWGCE
jgi:hypothetical protein